MSRPLVTSFTQSTVPASVVIAALGEGKSGSPLAVPAVARPASLPFTKNGPPESPPCMPAPESECASRIVLAIDIMAASAGTFSPSADTAGVPGTATLSPPAAAGGITAFSPSTDGIAGAVMLSPSVGAAGAVGTVGAVGPPVGAPPRRSFTSIFAIGNCPRRAMEELLLQP